MKQKTIVGVGAALVDLLIEESDEFLSQMGSSKGGMTLVDVHQIESALAKSAKNAVQVPGGSACNTLVGISHLGGQSRMIGCCGKDEIGQFFGDSLKATGTESYITQSDTPTGRVLSIVTPDAQRTMFTYLGAAGELSASILTDAHFKNAGIVHLEGYQLFNADMTKAVCDHAKKCGALLSLDLASFEVVQATKPLLESLVHSSVDILIANEDEASAYTGENEETSLRIFSELVEIAVVKLGKKGALVSRKGETIKVDAKVVEAIDTTGAGDLWASGFLYGLAENMTLKQSALLGAEVASEVVQVMGAAIPESGWQRIKAFLAALK